MKRLLMHFLLICLVTALLPSSAMAGDIQDVLLKLRDTMGTVQSLQCRFVQEKHLVMFNDVLKSEGELYFQRPSQLRWIYTSPTDVGFVINGDTGRRWNKALGTDQTFNVEDDMEMRILAEQVLGWTGFDLDRLQAGYAFSLLGESPLQLALTPKSAGIRQFISNLVVTITPEWNGVSRLEFNEVDGDTTLYEFRDLKTNIALDEALFTP